MANIKIKELTKQSGSNDIFAVVHDEASDELKRVGVGGFGIGVGQTWRDVKAERNKYTIYTNTTGRLIMLNIKYRAFQQGGIVIDGALVDDANTGAVSSGGGIIGVLIPNNSQYYLMCWDFQWWRELR